MEFQELRERFPAAPDYLSNMYLIERDYGEVNNHRLAAWLGVSAPAVSQALGRLKNLGLVVQEPYGAARLSDEGRDIAKFTLKRHYLLEHLLVRVLGYPWEDADDEAHVLQNYVSNALVDHLDRVLGHPDACPHGNPLPGSPRERLLLDAPCLGDMVPGQHVTVLRITEEGESIAHMLATCQARSLQPGVEIVVLTKDEAEVEFEVAEIPARLHPVVLALEGSGARTGTPDGVKARHRLGLDLARHVRVRVHPGS